MRSGTLSLLKMRKNLVNWDKVILILSVLDIMMALIMQSIVKIPYFKTFLGVNMFISAILFIEAIIDIKKYNDKKDALAKFM